MIATTLVEISQRRYSDSSSSFVDVSVGGTLWLHKNKLQSLPDSFGGISVGGALRLYGNQLQSLSESLKSTKYFFLIHQ